MRAVCRCLRCLGGPLASLRRPQAVALLCSALQRAKLVEPPTAAGGRGGRKSSGPECWNTTSAPPPARQPATQSPATQRPAGSVSVGAAASRVTGEGAPAVARGDGVTADLGDGKDAAPGGSPAAHSSNQQDGGDTPAPAPARTTATRDPFDARTTALRRLNLAHNAFREAGCCQLAALLLAPRIRVEELNLGHNGIGGNAATYLAEGLAQNRSCRVLDLTGNNFGGHRSHDYAQHEKRLDIRQCVPPLRPHFLASGWAHARGRTCARARSPPALVCTCKTRTRTHTHTYHTTRTLVANAPHARATSRLSTRTRTTAFGRRESVYVGSDSGLVVVFRAICHGWASIC